MAAEHPQVSSELSRDLSLFHITMMGMGMMIGAGVFLGIGASIGMAGPGGPLLTFALNGLLAIFTAMSYAELSSAIPRAGGAYNFTRVGFGRGPSFVAGWMEWFASSVAGSVYAVTFSIYMLRFFVPHVSDHPAAVRLTAAAVALFFLYVNYRGVSETGRIGAMMTLGQTLFLLFIGVAGVWVAVREPSRLRNFDPFLPNGWGKLLVTMGVTYVAFEGYEVIAQAGDEARDARRNVPKAMLYSVCFVTVTYVLVAFASVVAVQPGSVEGPVWKWIGSHGPKGFGEAVSRLMPGAGLMLTLAVVFAATSALNATVYSATRAAYALGRDRMLPGMFAAISRKRRTPWVALLFTGGLMLILATAIPVMDIASSASMMFLLLFLLVNLCVIKIRRNMADELQYGFLMPLFPLFPLAAIVLQAVLAGHLLQVSLVAWIVTPAWIVGGALVYALYSKKRAVATPDEVRVIEEEALGEGEDEAYRIMVAVANPLNAIELVRNTYKICAVKKARVELLHMAPVPDTVPLSDAPKSMMEGKEGIVEAMLYLAPLFPLKSHVRYCRDVARGIVSALREKRIDMLIMGWRGAGGSRAFTLGSTVDPVIERAHCNVVVMKDCGNRKFRRVLVPLAGGPNGALALEMASILVEKDEGEIVAFTVAGEKKPFDVDAFVARQGDRLHVPAARVRSKVAPPGDVVRSILRESDDYDLVVVGCTRDPWIYTVGRETIPHRVARLAAKPLVMVKAPEGIRSWIKRWV